MAGRDREVRLTVRDHQRLSVIEEILAGSRSQVSGSKAVGISTRWMKVLVKRVRQNGAAGLVHRNTGRASNRKLKAKVREEVSRLYREEYEEFNLNHFRQRLKEREGWEALPSRETLRGILMVAGLWTRQRQVPKHRQKTAWPRLHSRGDGPTPSSPYRPDRRRRD